MTTQFRSPLPQGGLTLHCRLSPQRMEALGRHPAGLDLVPVPDTAQPWQLPDTAEILVTEARGWDEAPVEAPTGWPGALRWLHVVAAGIDGYPDWIRAVPTVTCGRGANATAIAEYVLGAILLHDKRFFETVISDASAWKPLVTPLRGLAGKTLGLLGIGAIGREIARRAKAFDMEVRAFRRSTAIAPDPEITLVDGLEPLFATADHLVLAAPLTPQTRGIVSRIVLAHSKPGLHLINIARGALIDDKALLEALDDGRIGAATLDVTEPEPLPVGHAFYSHPRIRLTPHCSWSAEDTTERIMRRLFANIDRYRQGTPLEERIDPVTGY